jgi:hypothetical protein
VLAGQLDGAVDDPVGAGALVDDLDVPISRPAAAGDGDRRARAVRADVEREAHRVERLDGGVDQGAPLLDLDDRLAVLAGVGPVADAEPLDREAAGAQRALLLLDVLAP